MRCVGRSDAQSPGAPGTALDCLLQNAVKFTDNGDSIGIQSHVVGREVVLSVADSGIEIPQEDLARIFRTGSGAGDRGVSGLGLAIVTAVVEALDGSLKVVSAVGSGTRFTIRCPHSVLDRVPELVTPDVTQHPEATLDPLNVPA